MAIRTDPGLVRSHNEDAVFADAETGLAVLADGMGGYKAGEVASGMATAMLARTLGNLLAKKEGGRFSYSPSMDVAHHLAEEIATVNSAIFNAAASQSRYAGMGTTLVVACYVDNALVVAHLGDSRLYRLRENRFEQLTRDHSLLQEQIDCGMISVDEARFSNNRNLVTRALGVDPVVEPEIHQHDVQVGDTYLICSDGLTDMVDDDEIALTVQTLNENLLLAADQLIHLANDNGGRDNISVILVKVRGESAPARSWWQKLLLRRT
ncbi:MAG: Stp1/IreP family PP2C-type Ser/Thr phosphatase [Rhodocyclales bacterium GT-UBC]|nr:MAG: Stp1/IreP family PP2C-type Ser/Thr phosphatase [Rhodocyclales bacterium GT-UBC]